MVGPLVVAEKANTLYTSSEFSRCVQYYFADQTFFVGCVWALGAMELVTKNTPRPGTSRGVPTAKLRKIFTWCIYATARAWPEEAPLHTYPNPNYSVL